MARDAVPSCYQILAAAKLRCVGHGIIEGLRKQSREVTAELGWAGKASIWLTAKPAMLNVVTVNPASKAIRSVLGRRMVNSSPMGRGP